MASSSGTFFVCSLVSCSTTTSASSLAARLSRTSGSFSSSARIELTFQESTVMDGWVALSSLGARGGRGGSVTSHTIRGGDFGFFFAAVDADDDDDR